MATRSLVRAADHCINSPGPQHAPACSLYESDHEASWRRHAGLGDDTRGCQYWPGLQGTLPDRCDRQPEPCVRDAGTSSRRFAPAGTRLDISLHTPDSIHASREMSHANSLRRSSPRRRRSHPSS